MYGPPDFLIGGAIRRTFRIAGTNVAFFGAAPGLLARLGLLVLTGIVVRPR